MSGGAVLASRAGPVGCTAPQPAALLRLVCFPHSGGGPATFRGWAGALAPDVEVWTVTLPGRAGRAEERFARGWQALVDELAGAILDEVPPPVALFGHSLGAVLAFETARTLARIGAEPEHLVVSARSAPDVPSGFELPPDDDTLVRQVDNVYGGIPDAVRDCDELLRRFLPMLRADLELAVSYEFRSGPPLRCPITALAGSADRTVRDEELYRWRQYTTGDFAARLFPGGHFYLHDHEGPVLESIRRRLNE